VAVQEGIVKLGTIHHELHTRALDMDLDGGRTHVIDAARHLGLPPASKSRTNKRGVEEMLVSQKQVEFCS